jgi:Dolichyl-phosphate-mannose-protein mannosyltransferase
MSKRTQARPKRSAKSEGHAPRASGRQALDRASKNPLGWRHRSWPLFATLAVTLGLRLWQLGQGLPEFTEEAVPFRKALEMWRPNGSVDWNPHHFHYPSLTVYLYLFIQKLTYFIGVMNGAYQNPADFLLGFHIDPGAMVFPARLLGVVADLVTVFCVARISERLQPGSGVLAALLVACSSTMIRSSRLIFTDTVMTALVVVALERMLAWRAASAGEAGPAGSRRWGPLIAAVIGIGLAAGAKYPAVVLLVPLAWVLWDRLGLRAIAPWAACGLGVLGVFLLTTPFAILDWPTFSHDLAYVSRIGATGHLGNIDRPGFRFHFDHLREDMGWIGLVLLLASFALTVSRPRRQADAVTLWLAGLAFGVPIAFANVLADRYLVPVIPIAAVLISVTALALLSRVRPPAVRFALPAATALLVVPTMVGGVRTSGSGEHSTQTEAQRWCQDHLTRDQLLVQERYGAPLLTRLDSFGVQSLPIFSRASRETQARYRSRPWFSSVTLPLVTVGETGNPVRDRDGKTVELSIYPHSTDTNQACYDPRLLAGADFVLTTGLVRGRFENDPDRYPAQMRFYALLDSTAERVAHFVPERGDAGPEIEIYRLGPAAKAAFAALGPLDPLWWAAFVPDDYRRQADSLLSKPGRPRNVALRDSTGDPAAWVASLRGFFELRYAPLARAMAIELMEHRRHEPALRFAASLIAIEPDDVQGCLMFTECARQLGDWKTARTGLERCLSASAGGEPSPYLTLEYARVLAHDGEIERARDQLARALASGDEYVAAEANRQLEDPRGPFSASIPPAR